MAQKQLLFPFEQESQEEYILRAAPDFIKEIDTHLEILRRRLCSEGWDRFWIGNLDKKTLDLPWGLKLAWGNQYFYELKWRGQVARVYPVYPRDAFGMYPHPLWYLEGPGWWGSRLWAMDTLTVAQGRGVSGMVEHFEGNIEKVREGTARIIEKRMDKLARELAPDEETYKRLRPDEDEELDEVDEVDEVDGDDGDDELDEDDEIDEVDEASEASEEAIPVH